MIGAIEDWVSLIAFALLAVLVVSLLNGQSKAKSELSRYREKLDQHIAVCDYRHASGSEGRDPKELTQ